MILIRFIGNCKKVVGHSSLVYEKNPASINEIVSFMNRVALSPETKLKRDNILMVVNGVDSSVLNADELLVQDGDVVTVVPVVHGG